MLYLRRIIHPQARDNYRVLLKSDDDEIEIGSIGVQHGSGANRDFWALGMSGVGGELEMSGARPK